MTLKDIIEALWQAAVALYQAIKAGLYTLYTTELSVIVKTVAVVGAVCLAGYWAYRGLEALDERRERKRNENSGLPWYLRDFGIFSIMLLIMLLIIFGVSFFLVKVG